MITEQAQAYFEITGSYGYSQQVYGVDKNSTVTKSTKGGLAWYLWGRVALEGFISTSENEIINNTSSSGSGVTIISDRADIDTQSYGGGIKVIFADPRASFVPGISFGYAKQKQKGTTLTNVDTNSDGVTDAAVRGEIPEQETDSSYAVLSLKIGLTRYFGITGSVQTIVPDTDFSKTNDNIQYQVGLSWIF